MKVYFVLNSPRLTRDVILSQLYLDGKNRRQCKMNTRYKSRIISEEYPE